MKALDPILEERLDQAGSRWKWVRFVQHTATLGIVVTSIVLLLGAGGAVGWFTNKPLLIACLGLVAAGGIFAFLILGLAVAASRLEEARSAQAVERVYPALLDRLNTLVFLQSRRRKPYVDSFCRRIENQALSAVVGRVLPWPFSFRSALARMGILAVLVLATAWFYSQYDPFQRVALASLLKEEESLQLPPEEVEPEPEVPPWGEVRITSPGRDVTVTRVESVQLQIEASASQPVTAVEWITSLNGGKEHPHKLPPPVDPYYATYQPLIDLTEWELSDWDVMSYYAKATVEGGDSYVSDVYFIEVWPFREELEKMATGGGGSGESFSAMSQLTEMIERQKEVIKETHRQLHLQETQEESASDRSETHKALAKTEGELSETSRHFAASMTATFDPTAVQGPASHLAKAAESLNEAKDSFRQSDLPEARPQAQSALSDLIAARQELEKQIAENPEAFAPPEGGPRDLSEILERLTELRDESKSAAQAVRELVKKQEGIAERAREKNRSTYPTLAGEEDALRQELTEVGEEHQQAFQGVQEENAAADGQMQKAANQLRRRQTAAPQDATDATKRLEDLAQALEDQTHLLELARAYALKGMLDEQIDLLEQLQQQPGSMTGEQMQGAAGQMQGTAGEMKQIAETDPTRQDFRPPLRAALSDPNMQQLNTEAGALAQAQGDQGRMQAAGAMQDRLETISAAFEASQPQMLGPLQQGNAFRPGSQQAMAQGMQNLRGLMPGNREGGKSLSTLARMQLMQEALANLRDALDDEEWAQLMKSLQKPPEDAEEVDIKVVQSLIDQLQVRSVEVLEVRPDDEDDADARHIDPSKLPPAYRSRIQKYYQMLSEQ